MSKLSLYIDHTDITFSYEMRVPGPRQLRLVRPPGTPFRTGLYSARDVFFSPRFLRDPSTDRSETLPHDQNLTVFYKLTSKIRGPLPPKNLGAKNMQNFGQFSTTSDFDREYLRKAATHPKSERRTN